MEMLITGIASSKISLFGAKSSSLPCKGGRFAARMMIDAIEEYGRTLDVFVTRSQRSASSTPKLRHVACRQTDYWQMTHSGSIQSFLAIHAIRGLVQVQSGVARVDGQEPTGSQVGPDASAKDHESSLDELDQHSLGVS